MKRVFSVVLAVLLLISSVVGTMTFSASGPSNEAESMGFAANWTLYANESTHIGDNGTLAGSWAKASDNTDKKYVHSGDSSVKFSCLNQRGATVFSVKPNTDYEISFVYYADSLNAAGTYILSQVGVTTPNGKVNSRHKEDYLAYADRYEELAAPKAGEWQQVSLSFNSGANSTLALAITFAASPIYLDDFIIIDKSSTKLDKAANWTLYENKSPSIGVNGILAGSWAKASDNTDKKYVHSGDSSLKFSCINQRGAVVFAVEQNTDYQLSFWYYSDSLNNAGTYILSQVGVITPEGRVAKGSADYLAFIDDGTGTATTKTGEWQQINLSFNSGENNAVALTILFAASPVYVDDIELTKEAPKIETEDLTRAADWTLYANNSANIGANGTLASSWAKVTDNTNAAYIREGDSSLKFESRAQHSVTNFAVKPNTNYNLCFWYYTPSDISDAYIVSRAAITTPNGAVSSQDPKDYLALLQGRLGQTGTPEKGKWQSVILSFNSGENSEIALDIVFAASAYIVYVDAISLVEGEPIDPPTPPEPEKPISDPTNPKAWSFYASGTPNIGEGGILADSWAKVTENTNAAFIREGDSSLKFESRAQHSVTNFAVEPNTDYNLRFWYYTPSDIRDAYIVSRAAITAKNGTVSSQEPKDYLALLQGRLGQTGTPEKGKWQPIILSFNSGENSEIALDIMFAASAYVVYVDEISLTKGAPLDQPVYERDYGTPQDKWVIDFENPDIEYSKTNHISVVDTVGYDGKPTKALHTEPGEYSNAVSLNYNTTTTDTDPVYTIPVLPNRVYELSWRVKIAEGTGDFDWLSFYHCYNKTMTNICNLKNSKPKEGEWQEYKVAISTEDKQNRFSFYFNLGNKACEIWVDDITVTLTDYTAFSGYNGPQQKTLINFDDYYVTLTNPTYTVAKAPARDGVSSNAMFVKEGNYGVSQTLNPATCPGYNDKVFTVPVKENTLYRWSCWVYVPRKTPGKTTNMPYCCFFIDHGTRNLLHLALIVQGKNDEWVYCEKQFTTGMGQTQLAFFMDLGATVVNAYFDDICLEEMQPGVIQDTALAYCEEPYNLLASHAVAKENIAAVKTSVTEIAVQASTLYTFGATAQGNRNSAVYLSADGVSPLASSDAAKQYNGTVKIGSTPQRTAYQLVTPTNGKLYLVIKNNGGLQLSDVQLFKTKSLSGAAIDMGREENPNIQAVTDSSVVELVVVGSKQEQSLLNGVSPDTGDAQSPLSAVLTLVLSLLTVGVLAFMHSRKEKARHV